MVDSSENFADKVGRPTPCGQAVAHKSCGRNKLPNKIKYLMLRLQNHIRTIESTERFKKVRVGTQPMID